MFSMSQFSLRGKSTMMKLKLLNEVFVLDKIAILGQSTAIYAQFNTGKTLLCLWMLKESIKQGVINPDDVYYINADDSLTGLNWKNENIAEEYGFHMVAPGWEGFETQHLLSYMHQMCLDDTANGKIIFLDTLKKFTDLMNKNQASDFSNKMREFTTKGGTIIMMAHTNKNRNSNGKLVYGGTNDIPSDVDCVYTLDEISKNDTTKQVLFECIKKRGNNSNELGFRYSVEEDADYRHIFNSIELEDRAATSQIKQEKMEADKLAEDKPAIDAIIEAIKSGIVLKSEIIKSVCENSFISTRKAAWVLNEYKNRFWIEHIGDRNLHSYTLVPDCYPNY